MADRITHHPCGASLPADVGSLVEHLATCPNTGRELAAWSRAIVSVVQDGVISPWAPRAVSRDIRVPVGLSRKTPAKARDVSPSEMAAMRDTGKSLRDIAAIAGVAPETVRRRIAKHERGES